jgi:DNA-binding beta-propeller fold protein YncE
VFRKVTPDGTVTTIAGKTGEYGYANGVGSEARLQSVRYMAIDAADNVYFTEYANGIRKLSPSGEVSPVAGAPYSAGLIDDLGAFARFNSPAGLAFDTRGNLYVADSGNNAIRRITPSGQVSTVLGGGAAAALQPGLNGNINQPTGIVVTPAGRLVFISEGAIVGD